MKILEKGKKWSIECRCKGIGLPYSGCGALLEIEADDIYVITKKVEDETDEFMYTRDEYCYTFRCPCCNIETSIDEAALPINVKRNAIEKFRPSIKEIKVKKDGRMYL